MMTHHVKWLKDINIKCHNLIIITREINEQKKKKEKEEGDGKEWAADKK